MKRDWFCWANLITACVFVTCFIAAAVIAYRWIDPPTHHR